ncbi:homeobox protein CDX-2 [Amia ocellicauda]|uniref:homeobox protein CDX-2 n=1 Tax=Amia ocellicauda TaxID=2972642 RepID=UPI0034647AF2
MYVSYLLDKEVSMYPGSVRHSGLNLGAQHFVSPPQYPDYGHYHHVPVLSGEGDPRDPQPTPSWHYGTTREDWSAYPQIPPGGAHHLSASPGTVCYSPSEYSPGPLPPLPTQGVIQPLGCHPAEHTDSGSQRIYEWTRRSAQPAANTSGKTRTKDKYRVVYSDHQRLELEKEFHSNRYITIRRKADIAATLGLSERQVKIWFQNRRAKERKLDKKKQQPQPQPGPVQSAPQGLSPVVLGSASLVPGGGDPVLDRAQRYCPPEPPHSEGILAGL